MFVPATVILAQTLGVGAAAHSEARVVISQSQPGVLPSTQTQNGQAYKDVQSETGGMVTARKSWSHAALNLTYSPTILLTQLNATPQGTFLQTAAVDGSVHWGNSRTTYTLSENVSVARRSFLNEVLTTPTRVQIPTSADQGTGTTPSGGTNSGTGMPGVGSTPPGATGTGATGTGATGTGATGTGATGTGATGTGATTGTQPSTSTANLQPGASSLPGASRPFWLGYSSTTFDVAHAITHHDRLESYLTYGVGAGLGHTSRQAFPLIYGPSAGLILTDTLSKRDTLGTTVTARYVRSERGDRAASLAGSESYSHLFSRFTSGSLGAGVALVDNKPVRSPATFNVYPTGFASLRYSTSVGGGTFSAFVSTTFAPVYDQVNTFFDPRFTVSAGVGWTKRKFSASLGADSVVSLQPSRQGGVQYVGMNVLTSYQLGAGFNIYSGARAVKQTYSGQTSIPLTGSVFVGLGWTGGTDF